MTLIVDQDQLETLRQELGAADFREVVEFQRYLRELARPARAGEPQELAYNAVFNQPRELLYIVGGPGSGKSTLMAYLTRDLVTVEQEHRREYRLTKDVQAGNDLTRPRSVYWLEYYRSPEATELSDMPESRVELPVVYEWGRLADTATKRAEDAGWSRGTDRYDKCIHQWFWVWLEQNAPLMPLVIAEGDRLAYAEGMAEAQRLGYNVTAVLLDTPEEICARRRAARGSTQNDSWVKGRRTKAERFAEAFGALRLDGRNELWALEWALRDHPVVAALRAARNSASYVESTAF